MEVNTNTGLKFGKVYRVGNFTIKKYKKVLAKRKMAVIRNEMKIPKEIWKHLQQDERPGIPFIKVGTVSDTWSIEWSMGHSFYTAIDELPTDNEGNFADETIDAIHSSLLVLYANATTVGDAEYQAGRMRMLMDFIDRASASAKREPTPEDEQESREAAEDVYRNEQHKDMLLDLGKEVSNGID